MISAEGEQLGVVAIDRARELAEEAGLDLVAVSEKTDPPVVRIMNFGKLQYEQKKNLKNQKKNYDLKIKRGIEFMEKGCRLKVTLALRGREMAHQNLAFELMQNVVAELSAYGDPDGTPKLLGRNISVNFAPKA